MLTRPVRQYVLQHLKYWKTYNQDYIFNIILRESNDRCSLFYLWDNLLLRSGEVFYNAKAETGYARMRIHGQYA